MKLKRAIKATLWVLLAEIIGILGSVFTMSSVSSWYQTLIKPALNPPSFVFGPVWTLLYALMGIAMFLVWEKSSGKMRRIALMAFLVQLALNALWSPIFFGIHNIALALVDIGALWLAILWMIIVFHRIAPITLYFLLPYILWVSFAAYLNASLLLLN